jgi:RimJ/RimL family protein N-acetyltransferase
MADSPSDRFRTRETERLVLRLPAEPDLDPFREIHEDPEVIRHLTSVGTGTGRPVAWRMLAVLIGHWHLRGYGQWTVVEKATGLVVGRVGLWNPEGWPGLEVGWVIRRSHWGRGLATEAARQAIEFGFHEVGADHLVSLIRPDNPASVRVAQKIGERFERRETLDGHVVDVYGIRRPTSEAPV